MARFGFTCRLTAGFVIVGLLSLYSGDNYYGLFAAALILLPWARMEYRNGRL